MDREPPQRRVIIEGCGLTSPKAKGLTELKVHCIGAGAKEKPNQPLPFGAPFSHTDCAVNWDESGPSVVHLVSTLGLASDMALDRPKCNALRAACAGNARME